VSFPIGAGHEPITVTFELGLSHRRDLSRRVLRYLEALRLDLQLGRIPCQLHRSYRHCDTMLEQSLRNLFW
jgi:hypothetical protein